MSTNQESDGAHRQLGAFPFVLAGLSFIPLLGVLFGFITIVWGLFTKKRGGKKLALIGAGGIAFTAIFYGSFFYFGFVQRGGVYDKLRTQLAQSELDSLVNVIEVYRLTHGQYPDSLPLLKDSLPKGSIESVSVFDPRAVGFIGDVKYFYYKKIGSDHYYLRGVAPDGKPFSPGALVPQSANAGLGLLIDPGSDVP